MLRPYGKSYFLMITSKGCRVLSHIIIDFSTK
jgi:hypothetical protein